MLSAVGVLISPRPLEDAAAVLGLCVSCDARISLYGVVLLATLTVIPNFRALATVQMLR